MAIKITNNFIVITSVILIILVLLLLLKILNPVDKMDIWKRMKKHVILQKSHTDESYILPKIIWSFWHDENPPQFVSQILNQRATILKGWKHVVINEKTLSIYISELPPNYNNLRQSHKADLLRLALLEKYGGCWLDATVLVNSSTEFDNMYNESVSIKSDFTGFYTPMGLRNNDPTTFVESWFIMAPQKSQIIRESYKEFTLACTMGFDKYRLRVEKEHKLDNIYKINNPTDVYLTVYASIQIAIQKRLARRVNMILYNSYHTMYKLHCDCWESKKDDYDSDCIVKKLQNEKIYVQNIPYLKFTRAQYSLIKDTSNV